MVFYFSLTVNWETVWRANTKKKFKVHTQMNGNVGLLRIFPGINAAAVSILFLILEMVERVSKHIAAWPEYQSYNDVVIDWKIDKI